MVLFNSFSSKFVNNRDAKRRKDKRLQVCCVVAKKNRDEGA